MDIYLNYLKSIDNNTSFMIIQIPKRQRELRNF